MAPPRELAGSKALADPGVDILDDKVRARLAEIQAAAGVPHAQISLEVLYFLPKDFLNAYEQMFTRAVKADGGESARADAQQAAGQVGKARGNGAKPGKKYKKAWVVQDPVLLELKTRIDKRLRMMARDIEDGLRGMMSAPKTGQCSRCGMFLQMGWKFCPKDGTAQVED